jgi:hypothetical protein
MFPDELTAALEDEFEKLAAPRKKKPRASSPEGQAVRGAAAVVGAKGVQIGLNTAIEPQLRARAGVDSGQYEHQVRTMADKMGVKSNVHYMVDPRVEPSAGFRGKNFQINLPPGAHESFAAHEVGHVRNWEQLRQVANKLGLKDRTRELTRSAYLKSRKLAPDVGMGATLYSGLAEDPSYKPAVANLALHAPMLADEGIASARAAQYLVKQHGLMQGLRKARPLAPAFGTYATFAAAPFAITAGRKALRARREKTAASPTLAMGGVGALLGATGAAHREFKMRAQEVGTPLSPELKARRRKRLLWHTAATAAAVGAGGTLGAAYPQISKRIQDDVAEGVRKGGQEAVSSVGKKVREFFRRKKS